MKKRILILAVAALAASGCSKGIEKEYTMDVKEIVEVKNGEEYVHAAHCRKSLSLFNYYIVLPEDAYKTYAAAADESLDFSKLIAKSTEKENNYSYGKETVSDHGYVFVKWSPVEASK